MINELSQALYGEDETTPEELREWFAMSETVMLVAERPDGRLAAYADMIDAALERQRFWIDLRVPPQEGAPEVAAALLQAMEERAASLAAPGASIRVALESTDDRSRGYVETAGYAVFRHSFRMRTDFGDGDPPAPVWPEGISVRTIVRGQDDEAVWEAHQDAFEDGFEHATWPYENWREWAFSEAFDPSLWFLAEDGAEIAGVCLCKANAGAEGELGWVNVLGVRRPWRRRGLGRALLLHAFGEFHRRGKRGVGLGVDGLNPTGAVRLYEQAGMYVARGFDQYKKPLVT